MLQISWAKGEFKGYVETVILKQNELWSLISYFDSKACEHEVSKVLLLN